MVKIPSQLFDAFKNKEVVLFLGSGISHNYKNLSGFPNGVELANIIANKLLNKPSSRRANLLQIAQEAIWQSNGSRHNLENCIVNIFHDPIKKPLPTHQALAKLGIDMITTNYDTLIEQAFKDEGKKLSVIFKDKHLTKIKGKALIKIHGCITEPKTCVICEDDYYYWLERDPDMRALVRNYLITKTICFVGYSLSDSNFRNILKTLKFKFGQIFRESYALVFSVKKNNYDYNYLTKNLGVNVITGDATNFLNEICENIGHSSHIHIMESREYQNLYFSQSRKESYVQFVSKLLSDKIINGTNDNFVINKNISSLLRTRLKSKNPPPVICNGMAQVPLGGFVVGGERLGNEVVRIERIKKKFHIGIAPVINKEYKEFLDWINKFQDHGCCHPEEPHNKDHTPRTNFGWKNTPPDYFINSKFDSFPVVNVDWWDAYAYCSWRGGRLPTELEWERAARGIDGRIYPWGDNFDSSKCNTEESNILQPNEVKQHVSGISPTGCYDMAGNIWEWCADYFNPFDTSQNAPRVVKGGSFSRHELRAKCAFRNEHPASDRWPSRGFRLAKD